MSNTWELDSHDVSGVAKAPKLIFKINADRMSFSCESEGGRIDVTALTADGKRSRIVITNTLVGEVFADLEAAQAVAPSVGEDWNNPFVYAAEIGASLYWSMWRRQQIKESERVRGVLLEAVAKHKTGNTESTSPYEAACEAYEVSLETQGYNCGFVEDDAGFDAAHSVAIGAAVDAAEKAERERVLTEVEAAFAGYISDHYGVPPSVLRTVVAKLRGES